MKPNNQCLKNKRPLQETIKDSIVNSKNNPSLILLPILIVKLKAILMVLTILLDPPIPSKGSKCIDKKCLIKLKCIKDQLKLLELTPIENGLVMSELLIKKRSKNLEFKWLKNNKIQLKYLLNPKKSQHHYFKIQLNKIKLDFYKFKPINKHLDLKAEEKELN